MATRRSPGPVTSPREVNAAGTLNLQRAKLRLAIGAGKRPARIPKVSCLMPTKGRLEQAKLAIGAYRRQTWPNRELIVIDQNLDGNLASWVAGLNDPTIHVHSMPGLQEPLGTIRNRSIALSSGELICVWDDDDLQHPARLEIAILAMIAAGADACVLVRETIWMPEARRIGLLEPRYCANTFLAKRETGLNYPSLSVGEDRPAVERVMARHRTVLLDLPELYLYVVHGKNTCSERYFDGRWQNATDRSEGEATQSTLAQLARAYPLSEYIAALNARAPAPTAAPAHSLLAYDGGDVVVSARALVSHGRNPDGALATTPVTVNLAIGRSQHSTTLPLVSCLMPTKNRFDQARLAVECYRRQTWPNRELVVLDQNTDDRLASWVATLNDPTIRVLAMPGLAEPLGAVRNRSIDLARGDLVCVWDDDDLHHPARIEISVAAIAATKAAACMLISETMWTVEPSRVAILQRANENTLIMARDPAFRYPALPRGEDKIAVQQLLGRQKVVLLDLPDLYLYVRHGRNTWDNQHTDRLWHFAAAKKEGAAAAEALRRLARAYPIAEYTAALMRRESPPPLTGDDVRLAAQR